MTFQEFVEKLMADGSLADKIVEPTTRAAALKPMGINAGSPISNAINQVFNDANCMRISSDSQARWVPERTRASATD